MPKPVSWTSPSIGSHKRCRRELNLCQNSIPSKDHPIKKTFSESKSSLWWIFSASFSLPFVNESHKDCHNVERIIELDQVIQAYLSNHVANRASFRQVSRQFFCGFPLMYIYSSQCDLHNKIKFPCCDDEILHSCYFSPFVWCVNESKK